MKKLIKAVLFMLFLFPFGMLVFFACSRKTVTKDFEGFEPSEMGIWPIKKLGITADSLDICKILLIDTIK